MTTSHQERLSEIERRIAAVEEPHGLMRFIEENADLATAPGETGVRYAAARGIVLNRTGLPGSARLELQKARDKAEAEGVAALMSGISREIARVHVWRGETTSAALELLRSLVEADATGEPRRRRRFDRRVRPAQSRDRALRGGAPRLRPAARPGAGTDPASLASREIARAAEPPRGDGRPRRFRGRPRRDRRGDRRDPGRVPPRQFRAPPDQGAESWRARTRRGGGGGAG